MDGEVAMSASSAAASASASGEVTLGQESGAVAAEASPDSDGPGVLRTSRRDAEPASSVKSDAETPGATASRSASPSCQEVPAEGDAYVEPAEPPPAHAAWEGRMRLPSRSRLGRLAVASMGTDVDEDGLEEGSQERPLGGLPPGARGSAASSRSPEATDRRASSMPLLPAAAAAIVGAAGIGRGERMREGVGAWHEDEGDWSGRVAAERAAQDVLLGRFVSAQSPPARHDGATTALVAALSASAASVAADGGFGLSLARRQLAVAIQALQGCDAQLRVAGDLRADEFGGGAPGGDVHQLQRAMRIAAAEAAEARAEAESLRQETQRLRGVPRELSPLSNDQLHTLLQELSAAQRSVQSELENRSRCCACRVQERDVVLQPCMHLVLCRECASRVTSCPLCRCEIDSHTAVRVT